MLLGEGGLVIKEQYHGLCPSVEESTALCQGKLAWQPEPNSSMALMDPHKQVLVTGGQATQDRTTFPVGK